MGYQNGGGGVNLSSLRTGVYPTTIGSPGANGPTVDYGVGTMPCFCIQHIGTLEEEGTLDGKIQQSDNGSAWSDIAGATFTQVDGSNDIQAITFTKTMRYVRYVATVTGASAVFNIGVLFGKS